MYVDVKQETDKLKPDRIIHVWSDLKFLDWLNYLKNLIAQ